MVDQSNQLKRVWECRKWSKSAIKVKKKVTSCRKKNPSRKNPAIYLWAYFESSIQIFSPYIFISGLIKLRQVELGGHYLSPASSHHRIFASSQFVAAKFFGSPRSVTSSHLRDFGSPKILIPSPQLRIIASSRLRLSGIYCYPLRSFASSHLRIFATSALQKF